MKIVSTFKLLSFIALLLAFCNTAAAQDESPSQFEQDIARLGFDSDDLTDLSDQKKINIGMPTCAYVNISGINNLPPRKTSNYHAWVEFYDGQGNYFKKRVLINLQGKSSTTWPKKNYALDFCEDEWIGDKTPDIKIGDWVKQDAFHIKAYYLDKFRGTGAIGYKVYDMIIAGRGERPWNRAEIAKPDADARCTPDGFPAIVYVNGDFYGVYSWQLKKHRKNYNLDKNNPLHIHLDGNIRGNYLFATSDINWTAFEVRSPKTLYNMDGTEYNGDAPKELMDETSPYYDLDTDDESVKEAKRITAATKHGIEQLRDHWFDLKALIESGASKETIRAEIAKRFDVPSIIDYIIHNLLTNNLDGLNRNWQWFTYDGYKWFVAPYDLDATFGYHTNYFTQFPPENYAAGYLSKKSWKTSMDPLSFVNNYYLEDIYAYYADIRNRGLLTADGVVSLFDNWYYSVGEDNYDREFEKWSGTPFTQETVCNPNWQPHEWDNVVNSRVKEYDANTTYEAGDLCRAAIRIWEATGTTTGVYPFVQYGCPDGIDRIHTWVPEHLKYLDMWMKYTPAAEMASFSLQVPESGWTTICVPFQFEIPEGIELFNVTGFVAENSRAKLETVTTVEPNKPYLVKGTPGRYLLIGEKVEGDATAPDYLVNGLLHGTYAALSTSNEKYLLQTHQSESGFYTSEGNLQTTIVPNTAYLVLNTTLTAPEVVYLSTDDTVPDYVTVNISSAGFATYCSNFDLNFEDVEGFKAFIICGYNNSTGKIKAVRVEDAPAETGLFIMGNPGSYQIPTTVSSNFLVNMLVGTTEEIYLTMTEGDMTNLILTSSGGQPNFSRLSKDGPFAANKAYLQLPSSLFSAGTNTFKISFEDEGVDGIETVAESEQQSDTYYTVTGVKTTKPQRGIYIQSGKKVVKY